MNQRIRLKIGSYEIELDGEVEFIEEHLKKFMELVEAKAGGAQEIGLIGETTTKTAQQPGVDIKLMSPAEWVRYKGPQGGLEQLLVLGKFLEDVRMTPEFKLAEINALAGEAKLKDIHGQYVTNAVKQGYLRQIANGKYSITLSGEDLVLAMTGAPK